MPDDPERRTSGPARPGFAEAPAKFDQPRVIEMPAAPRPVNLDADYGDNPHRDEIPTRNLAAAFTKEDAMARSGNFVIPFGLPGSGKTTFLAALFQMLSESPALRSQIIVPERNKVANYAGQAMLTQWTSMFRKGRFMGATQRGDFNIRDIEYKIEPLRGQSTSLTFSVVEVSGEDLARVIATDAAQPKLPAAVEAVFTNTRIKPLIVLVLHPNRSDNDLLFDNLFVQLRRLMGPRMNNVSLLAIIANPRLALHRLKEARPELAGHQEMTPELADLYLRQFARKTYAVFNTWPKKKRGILPFYVGSIEIVPDGEDEYERIAEIDDTHVKMIFRFIYRQFTGKRLGQMWYQRLLRSLND